MHSSLVVYDLPNCFPSFCLLVILRHISNYSIYIPLQPIFCSLVHIVYFQLGKNCLNEAASSPSKTCSIVVLLGISLSFMKSPATSLTVLLIILVVNLPSQR